MFARRRFLRIVSGAALVAVLGSSSAVAAPASSQATASVCQEAQQLLAEGFLVEAQSAFAAQLGKDSCAIAGIRRVLALQAGTSATPADAAAAVKARQRFDQTVSLIRRLQAEGFEQDARKQLEALTSAYPSRDIPEDVRKIDQPIGWWRQAEGTAFPVALSVAEIAITLLGLVLLGALLAKASAALAGRLRPQFTVADMTGPVAEDVAGQSDLLAAELARLVSGGSDQIRRVPASEGSFTLPDAITGAYPQAGVIVALLQVLDRVLPRELLTVDTAALPEDPVRGVGVTVTIAKRDGRQAPNGRHTFWEAEFGPVDTSLKAFQRLERLMLPAAVWLLYNENLRQSSPDTLGSRDWCSYALYALGDRAQKAGKTPAARHAYFSALDADARNVGARMNLAGLLFYAADKPSEELAKDREWRQEFAGWLLNDTKTAGFMVGPAAETAARRVRRRRLLWRWLYLCSAQALGAGRFAAAYDPSMPGPQTAIDALCTELAAVGDDDPLAAEMRWPAFLLRRSILLEKTHRRCTRFPVTNGRPAPPTPAALIPNLHVPCAEALAAENEEFLEAWWTANTLYNLACLYARFARVQTDHVQREAAYDKARQYLDDALARAAEPTLLLDMADHDAALVAVAPRINQRRRDHLTDATDPDAPAHKAGHALGIKIGEAIGTAMRATSQTVLVSAGNNDIPSGERP